jgi:hypothetical protein
VYRFGAAHYDMAKFLDANYNSFHIFVFQNMNKEDMTWTKK